MAANVIFLMISIILTSYTRHFPEAWMSEKMDEAYQTNIGFFTTTNDSKLAVWIATVHFSSRCKILCQWFLAEKGTFCFYGNFRMITQGKIKVFFSFQSK